IDTVNLISGYVALDPLNLRSQLVENATGLLRDATKLLLRQFARAGQLALNQILGHKIPLESQIKSGKSVAGTESRAQAIRTTIAEVLCSGSSKNPVVKRTPTFSSGWSSANSFV